MSDIQRLKRELHPVYVMDHLGHSPIEVLYGKFVYHSPFREDKNPSFDIYYHQGQRCWKYGDMAAGIGGDVVDLLELFYPGEGIVKGYEILTMQVRTQWKPPVEPEQYERNFEGDQPTERDKSALRKALGEHIALYPPDPTTWPAWATLADDLHDVWKLWAVGSTLRIPYFDVEGKLVGWKDRLARLDDNKRNAKGSRAILYGLWRHTAHDDRPILLAEGETDTWVAQHRLGDGWVVLGVPGVGHNPGSVGGQHLSGRNVYLCLDPDDAGRSVVGQWVAYLQGNNCSVAVVGLPEGKDISDCTIEEFQAAIAESRFPSPAPPGFVVANGMYCHVNQDGAVTPTANWSLQVERVLSSKSGEQAYEGIILPTRRSCLLPAGALHNQSTITRWSSSHGVAWYSGGQAPQKLSALLQHETLGLPTGKYTHQLGLNDGVWVLPDRYIGSMYHRWDPLPGLGSGRQISDGFHFHDKAVQPAQVIDTILSSYDIRVSSVLLAWLAVAPLRSLFDQFPFLFVTGGKGSGKSTTPAAAALLMNGVQLREAASGSIHNIQQMVGSNRSFPYQIDEYRANTMTREKRAAFEDLLRLAYDGQPMPKGGQDRSNVSLVFEFSLTAPIILSGENDIKDPAMRDRIIPLRFDKRLMKHLPDMSLANLGQDYLKFLQEEAWVPINGKLSPSPAGPRTLSERQRLNLGVIQCGWGLVGDYLLARGSAYQLPLWDPSYVIDEFEAAEDTSPLRTAARLLLDSPVSDAVMQEGELIHVRLERFLEDSARLLTVDLPYDSVTRLKDHLQDEFGAELTRPRVNGVRVRAMSFPSDVLQ